MDSQTQPDVNIVVPLYNEEEIFQQLVDRLNKLITASKLNIEVILIDDGSRDRTAELMTELCLKDEHYNSVFLSRNFGHQLALTAGLSCINAKHAVMVIDGDLQDPPELLEEFYEYYLKGYDVVYAVRKKRKESFFKRMAYKIFYRILKRVSYLDIPLDSGDFSLMSTRVVNHLNKMPEESRFMRGLRTWVGYKQIGVEYERSERQAGTSKYPFSMLLKLAFNGIFNFSEYPVKVILNLGIVAFSISIIYFISVVIKKLFFHPVAEGFTALLFTIIMFSGVQMIALGLIGEYVLRIFLQSKNRPLFIVREKIFNKERISE